MLSEKIHNTVQGLWIEGQLSILELLTICSFQEQGYEFHLWTYHLKNHNLPQGVILKDARLIIPENEIFSYSQKNQFGHGKGSYAGFSDVFRYKLLYEYGGWWTDMDITCLRRLPKVNDYFFRANKLPFRAIGNLIYCEPKSPIMHWCYQKASTSIHQQNENWSLPITILNEGIQKFGLQSYIHTISNPDSWLEVSQLITDKNIPESYLCIHWMNEEFRRLKISKEEFPEYSNLFRLARQYQIPVHAISHWKQLMQFYIKTSRLYYILINLKYLPAYLLQR